MANDDPRRWMYHPTCREGRIVPLAEVEKLEEEGWVKMPSDLPELEEEDAGDEAAELATFAELERHLAELEKSISKREELVAVAEEALEAQKTELDERASKLDEQAQELAALEQELAAREEAIAERDRAAEAPTPPPKTRGKRGKGATSGEAASS